MSGACGPMGICIALSPVVATATGVSPCIAAGCCKVRQSKCREIIQKIMIPSAILLAIAATIIFGWSGPVRTSLSALVLKPLEEPFTGYGYVLGVVMALAWAIPTVLSCCTFYFYGELCCKDLKDEVPTDQADWICAKYWVVFALLVLNSLFPLAVVGFFYWKLNDHGD